MGYEKNKCSNNTFAFRGGGDGFKDNKRDTNANKPLEGDEWAVKEEEMMHLPSALQENSLVSFYS